MNLLKCINTEYLRPSRSIETVLVTKVNLSKVFFIYNYEGNSYRVFERHLSLILFFQDKAESDLHFSTEAELDHFLSRASLST
jgi:hypothetical protein